MSGWMMILACPQRRLASQLGYLPMLMDDIGTLTSDEFATAARLFLMKSESKQANYGNIRLDAVDSLVVQHACRKSCSMVASLVVAAGNDIGCSEWSWIDAHRRRLIPCGGRWKT